MNLGFLRPAPPNPVAAALSTLFSAVSTSDVEDPALEGTSDVTFSVNGSLIKGNRAILVSQEGERERRRRWGDLMRD